MGSVGVQLGFINGYLVGALEHEVLFPIQLGISSSQLTNSYFSEGYLADWPYPYIGNNIIFFRGVSSNHQPGIFLHEPCDEITQKSFLMAQQWPTTR